MGLALTLSQRSTCSRLSVGCVVVSLDNTRVLALGYNGGPRGLSNECLSTFPGACGHLHAEINALIKLDYGGQAPRRLYVTHQPCYTCAVAIINAGISEVVYGSPYRDMAGLELLWKHYDPPTVSHEPVRQFLPEGAT